MTEKTLDSVDSVDETKDTETQDTGSLHDEEGGSEDAESTEDLQDGGDKKPFKDRKERAEFFKKKEKTVQPVAETDKSDVLTKSELFKMNEKKAVRIATSPSENDSPEIRELKSEINDNWEAIVRHYNRGTDRSDPENIVEAIFDAHTLWKRRNPTIASKKSDVDTKARASLMADRGTKGSSAKGAPEKKSTILGNASKGMSDWFPKKD